LFWFKNFMRASSPGETFLASLVLLSMCCGGVYRSGRGGDVVMVDVDVGVGVGVGVGVDVDADVLGVDAIAGTDAGTGGVFASSIMATAVGALLLLLLLLLLLGKSVATGLLLIEHCCVRDREKGSRSGLFRMYLQGTGNESFARRKWSDAWVKPKV
jgi:hypothetical protein